MRLWSIPVLLLALAGCRSAPENWRDDYDWIWEGEHVTVYAYERLQEDACGGSFAALDLHSGSVAEFFAYDADLHHDYLWMSQTVWDGKCQPRAAACTASGVPWTRSVPDMHEATHAVSYASRGHVCPSLIEEGVAEYFGRPRFHSFFDPNTGEYAVGAEDLLTAAPIAFGDYERAGNFASFLVEEYGAKAVAGLCEEVPFYSTTDDWEAAVPRVLDIELSQLLAAYEQYPRCYQQQFRARLWECDGDPHAFADPDDEVVFDIEMDCADEGVIGPFGSKMVATRRIAFPKDMRTGVFLRGEDGEAVDLDFNLQECVACSENPDVHSSSELTTVFEFRAGVYDLLIYADREWSETLSVHLVPI